MPAATNRSELLLVHQLEYEKLLKTLSGVDAELADKPSKDDAATIKETIAHRTHWSGLYLGWYADGKAGKDVQTPAPGYKWNQLKEYNATIREASHAVSWQDTMDGLKLAHQKLTDLLTSMEDAELYTKHLYPWMNNWTLGRWAEASGASHYRSANKYARKILREQKA